MFIPDSPSAIKVYEQKNAINKDASLGSYFISEEKYETLKGFELFPNDIIVSCAGTIGETYVMPETMRKGIINQALMKISLYDLRVIDFYLIFFDCQLKNAAREQGHGVALKNIPPFDVLKKYLVPIPPIQEQTRIVDSVNDVLGTVSSIDTFKDELFDSITSVKSKILDLAVRGKLVRQNPDDEPASVLLERIRLEKEELIRQGKIKRDKKESVIFKGEDNSYYRNYENKSVCIDENIPFEIPSNWEWCNLSMIGSTNIGLTYKPEDIVENGTMVLRSSNIVNGKIDLTDLVCVKTSIRENQYIEENDILICARNGSKALVGKCAIFSGIVGRASFGAFMAVYRTEFYKFVYYFLNSTTFRSTFNSDDTKQINQLTQDMIKNALIPLPPIEEQIRIVEAIENTFAQLDAIAESLS